LLNFEKRPQIFSKLRMLLQQLMLNESYVKTIHFTRRVYTHYLVMARE